MAFPVVLEAEPIRRRRVYTTVETMGFEWDDRKSESNEGRHGIDFKEASELFDGRYIYVGGSPRGE